MKSVLKIFILLFGLEFTSPLPTHNVELLTRKSLPNQHRIPVINQNTPAPPVLTQYQTETVMTQTTPLSVKHQQIVVPSLSSNNLDLNQRWIPQNNVQQQNLQNFIARKTLPMNQVTVGSPQKQVLTVQTPDSLNFEAPVQYQSPQQKILTVQNPNYVNYAAPVQYESPQQQKIPVQTPNSVNYAAPVQYESPQQKILTEQSPNSVIYAAPPVKYQSPQQPTTLTEQSPNSLKYAVPLQYQSPQHSIKKTEISDRPYFQTEQQLLEPPRQTWIQSPSLPGNPANPEIIKTMTENQSTTAINSNSIKSLYNHLSNQFEKDNAAPDYNINKFFYNMPALRHALVPPPAVGKKRYVVIQADGTIEHVDKLDTIVEKYPDYILVGPKNLDYEKGVNSNTRSETKSLGAPIRSGYTVTQSNPQPPLHVFSPNQGSLSSVLYSGNASDLKTLPLVKAVPKPSIPSPSVHTSANINQIPESATNASPKNPESVQELNRLRPDQSIIQPPLTYEDVSQSKISTNESEKQDNNNAVTEKNPITTQIISIADSNASSNEDTNHISKESEKIVQNTNTSVKCESKSESEGTKITESEDESLKAVTELDDSEITDKALDLLFQTNVLSQEVEEKTESAKRPFVCFTTSDPDFWSKLLGDDPEAIVYFFQSASKNEKSESLDSECKEELSS